MDARPDCNCKPTLRRFALRVLDVRKVWVPAKDQAFAVGKSRFKTTFNHEGVKMVQIHTCQSVFD